MERLLFVWFLCLVFYYTTSNSFGLSRDDAQQYLADGWFSSAEQVEKVTNVYTQVGMKYDCIYDTSFEQCQQQDWIIPIQYSAMSGYWNLFIQPWSCLGVGGPLGPFGVLSTFGPLGMNFSTPMIYVNGGFNGTCDWCQALDEWFTNIQNYDQADPLGINGPLGLNGTLSPSQIYNSMYHLNEMFFANNFPTNLDITGIWGILGPLSVLGSLGAIGPLGPIYQSALYSTINPITHQNDGQYRLPSTNTIIRQLSMQYSDQLMRVYDLFELYTPAVAEQLGISGDQDTSFAVENNVSSMNDLQMFRFCSHFNQTVSVIVFPSIKLDPNHQHSMISSMYDLYNITFSDFALEILDDNHKVLMRSSSQSSTSVFPPLETSNYHGLIDWIIFRAKKNHCFYVRISPQILNFPNNSYRLFVTGTGFSQQQISTDSEENHDLFNHQNIVGSFQSNYFNPDNQ